MKTTDIRIGDLIEFRYIEKTNFDELILKGLVTRINNDTFTIRDEKKNSPKYMEYVTYEKEKVTWVNEVLELTIPLTDREKDIIRYYENHISDIYSIVEDELHTARGLIDELSYQITSVENEVVGDKEEDLIEYLSEQEAEERRNSIQAIVGKDK